MSGFVDSAYGPLPGCPVCGVIPLSKAHICEHGVTPVPKVEIHINATIEDAGLYARLLRGQAG